MIRFVFLSAITGSSQQYITPFKNHRTILKSLSLSITLYIPPSSEANPPVLHSNRFNRSSRYRYLVTFVNNVDTEIVFASIRLRKERRERERGNVRCLRIETRYWIKVAKPRILGNNYVSKGDSFDSTTNRAFVSIP